MPGNGEVQLTRGVRPVWPMMGGILLLGTVLAGCITGGHPDMDDPRGLSLTNSENIFVFELHRDELTVLGAPGEVDG